MHIIRLHGSFNRDRRCIADGNLPESSENISFGIPTKIGFFFFFFFFFFFLRHNGLFLPNESAWRLSEIFQLSAESSRQNKHSTELLFNLATAMSYSLQPQLSSQRLIVANFSLVSILVLTYRDHTVQYYISLQVSTPASPASAMLHGISVLVS